VPRSAEIQPGFSRFVNIYLFFFFFFFFLNPLPSSSCSPPQYNNLNSRHSAPQRKDANILRPVRFRCLVDLRLWRVFQKKTHTHASLRKPRGLALVGFAPEGIRTQKSANWRVFKIPSERRQMISLNSDGRGRAHAPTLFLFFSWGKNFTNPMLPCHVRGPVRIIFVPMILKFH